MKLEIPCNCGKKQVVDIQLRGSSLNVALNFVKQSVVSPEDELAEQFDKIVSINGD